MAWLAASWKRVLGEHRLLILFAATVVAPALLLGLLGIRSLLQEREFARREVHDRLRASLDTLANRASQEFVAWQQAIDAVARAGPASSALWPERVRRALAGPEPAVLLFGSAGAITAVPAESLLYRVGPERGTPAAGPPLPPLLLEAESLEMRDIHLDQAAELYRRVLASGNGTAPSTLALHHLDRTLKKAGRTAEAVRAFEQLRSRPPTPIGSLPSGLLAQFALLELNGWQPDAALALYRDLTGGRWPLAKFSYLFYAEKLRSMLPPAAVPVELERTVQRKAALTSAVERFLENPRRAGTDASAGFAALWCEEPFAALVVAESGFWSGLFGPSPDRDLEFSIATTGGASLAGAPPSGSLSLGQALQLPGLSLQLTAWPRNPAALLERSAGRQNFYLGMIAGVAGLLAVGIYLVIRTVRAELAFAQLKAGFVSTVSHEFRSPLAGINQLGEMLSDGRVKDEERRQHYYRMIVSETQRLRRLVENVLDFSRMEEGRQQYRFEPFDSRAWLEELLADTRRELAASGRDLAADIPGDLPALAGDREALTTAVRNLLDNAVKFSNGAAGIRLEARVEDAGVAISVQDFGVGIDEQDQPRIFEKFYRGAATAQEVKGAGLGLSLVRHIITAHGGEITFTSRKGEGSTFTIRLKGEG